MADRERHTARHVALLGGAAFLAWWLLRGKGWGLGHDGQGSRAGAPRAAQEPPCRVWIRANRIELDGAPIDLPTLVARCRERGRAEVRATGDAITRSIAEVLRSLYATGIEIDTSPHLAGLGAPEATR
ncbi:MAG: hypothetical protein ACTHU0_10370 [Kofleriaceae bacterium]